MGLAASQSRVFLLTARAHDLTYRGNQITQSRLLLASDQEAISKKYARKTGNRQIKMVRSVVAGETNVPREVNLTYANLNVNGQLGTSVPRYRVVDRNGTQITPGSGTNQDPRLTDLSEVDNYLQDQLRNGVYRLEELKPDPSGDSSTPTWQPVTWSADDKFSDDLYTKDDADAKAEYDAAMNKVQAMDKRLEVEQKDVETQYKAVSTEQESLIKLVSNLTEKSFKVFA